MARSVCEPRSNRCRKHMHVECMLGNRAFDVPATVGSGGAVSSTLRAKRIVPATRVSDCNGLFRGALRALRSESQVNLVRAQNVFFTRSGCILSCKGAADASDRPARTATRKHDTMLSDANASRSQDLAPSRVKRAGRTVAFVSAEAIVLHYS